MVKAPKFGGGRGGCKSADEEVVCEGEKTRERSAMCGAAWRGRVAGRMRIAGRHQLDTVQLNWTVTYAYVATDPGGCRSGLSCGYV